MKGKKPSQAVTNHTPFSQLLVARKPATKSWVWQSRVRLLARVRRVRSWLSKHQRSKRRPSCPIFLLGIIVPFCEIDVKRRILLLNSQVYAHCAHALYRRVVILGREQLQDFRDTVLASLSNGKLS